MNIHRRSKSGSAAVGPSKLSHITAAPLTPTDETSGDVTPSATGFFSSMISAAQNAATSISNTIPNAGLSIGANKSRTSIPKSQSSPAASQTTLETEPAQEPEPRIEDTMDRKESAVRTLGSGDLSLSQLGLAEASVASPASARFPDVADTRTRSESAPADPQTTGLDALPGETSSRPRSLVEPASGEQTPPQMEFADIKGPVQRSSSLRSAIKPHRKRGSSVTTGGTIAAAISSAHNTALPTSGSLGTPKLTGFAIASKKRNRDFHTFFKSVPDDDYLIEDYSCALQREILAHGRLYVSEGHLCFSSNILGWTTTLVMSFDEIVSVEKRSTALVFKNGLMISTLHAKHIFASFTSRDATYDLIVNIWKLGHPTLRSTLNGVQLEGTGGDKTEKVEAQQEAVEEDPQEASESEEDSDDEEDEFYDEEEHNEGLETQSTDMTAVEPDLEKTTTRKVSGMTTINGLVPELPKDASPSPAGVVDFPGPIAHPASDCGDSATHYDKILGDEIIPAPLGKVYNLVFGPGSVAWMNKWLSTDQKCTDIQMEDKKGLTADNKTRTFTYIKPLNGSIGPKQTKCVVTEGIEQIDLEKAVNISVSTQTPDVPYGNLFTVKTKYCMSWAENNATRVQINCTVEWSGKCWLKGMNPSMSDKCMTFYMLTSNRYHREERQRRPGTVLQRVVRVAEICGFLPRQVWHSNERSTKGQKEAQEKQSAAIRCRLGHGQIKQVRCQKAKLGTTGTSAWSTRTMHRCASTCTYRKRHVRSPRGPVGCHVVWFWFSSEEQRVIRTRYGILQPQPSSCLRGGVASTRFRTMGMARGARRHGAAQFRSAECAETGY